MDTLLEVKDLCKQYKGAGNYMAVYHMNLSIPRGKIIGLLGPNGCGKTTLIKMINGLLAPSCGTVTINGYAPGIETKKIVSYLPERTYLQSNMRIREMISYFKDFYEDFNEDRAYGMLSSLDIDPDARLKTLSKGTKEKVQLILVMSREAELYILDEPTTGLHFADVHKLTEILRRLAEGGNTVVVIEHNLDVIKTADYIIDVGPEGGARGGTIVATGTPEEIAENPNSYTGIYIKKFLERDK